MKNITIIIPFHNHLEDTKKALKSLADSLNYYDFANKDCNIGITVVDDGSTDGSAEWISDNYPEIEIIKGDGNLWWSRSVNLGIKCSIKKGASHVLLFNNDNMVERKYFETLDKAIFLYGADVIIVSKVINLFPEKYIKYAGEICNRKKARFFKNPNPEKSLKVNSAGGMGVIIPVSVFDKIGFFDAQNFPQSRADIDFYLRAENSGIDMYYDPKMVVYNNNLVSGFKSNINFREVKKAYSYPRGYKNLKIDIRFCLKHFGLIPSIIHLITKNLRFNLGLLKNIIKL